ncbi:PREDICTED: glutathione S-transferase 1-like isoform X2 [Priapulus caudatus]|nr:PREDICTED: glutathione S-transferase 1-like isoform X2 [Priapulus caudatus]
MGNSNWEIGKIDETTENIKDMNELTGKLFFHKDGDTKAELQKKAEDMVAKTLKWLDSQLRENGTHGFLVGKNLSVADITSYNALSCLIENGFASSVEGYPVLKAHTDRISNIPAIKRWVNSRPKTPF